MKTNDSHSVHIVLRDWTKAKKRNRPVAETHTKETKKK